MKHSNSLQIHPKDNCLLLRAIRKSDGSIYFKILAASDTTINFIQHIGLLPETQKEIHPRSTAVHQWTETVLRSKFMPEDIVEDIFQYYPAGNIKAAITITCSPNSDIVKICFSGISQYDPMITPPPISKTHGSWVINPKNGLMLCSHSLAEALHFGSCAMIISLGRFIDLIVPDDLPVFLKAITCTNSKESAFHVRLNIPQGETAHLSMNSIAICKEDGYSTDKVYGTFENTTESSTRTTFIDTLNRRMDALITSTTDFLIILDESGRYVYVSPQGEKYLSSEKNRTSIQAIINSSSHSWVKTGLSLSDNFSTQFLLQLLPILRSDGKEEYLCIGHDISELDALIRNDSLTSLNSRDEFWNIIEHLKKHDINNFCIATLDINGLRMINDVFGHKEGDSTIKLAAEIIKEVFPSGYFLARLHGGEFAVIAYDTTSAELEALCEMIDLYCSKATNRVTPLNIAWGIACKDSSKSIEEAIRLATLNMYTKKLTDNSSIRSQIVSSLEETLKSRDIETADHMNRMRTMVQTMGKELRLGADDFTRLVLLAGMHDIGKISIPDHIIRKPEALSDDEWTVMQTHCEAGYNIAMSSKELSTIADEILHHHEHWDGSGYPFGKSGDEIPLLSQIISVVDAYDVMTNDRIYKNKISHEEAVLELRRCSGTQFSPYVVELFLHLFGTKDHL